MALAMSVHPNIHRLVISVPVTGVGLRGTFAAMAVRSQETGETDPPSGAVDGEGEAAAETESAEPSTDPKAKSTRQNVIEWAAVIVGAVLFALVIRSTTVATYKIPSQSMEPTLHGCKGCTGDRVIVNKWSYRLHDIHRGDVVVFGRPPRETNTTIKDLIKRVVGLPGETIEIREGAVFVNQQRLNEPYINPACPPMPNVAPITVPAKHIFVMGDNRCASEDSRIFGPVAQSLVVGRATARIFPFDHLGWL
jgi:signal peptidase I